MEQWQVRWAWGGIGLPCYCNCTYSSTKSYFWVTAVSKNLLHVSSIDNISLKDYVLAHRTLCAQNPPTCTECNYNSLLMVARSIMDNGYVIMSDAFRISFPAIKYTAEVTHWKFLQMFLVRGVDLALWDHGCNIQWCQMWNFWCKSLLTVMDGIFGK